MPDPLPIAPTSPLIVTLMNKADRDVARLALSLFRDEFEPWAGMGVLCCSGPISGGRGDPWRGILYRDQHDPRGRFDVMASIPESRTGLSLEEFLNLPEIDRRPYLEYIDGRIVPKVSPKRKHSAVQIEFGSALNAAAAPAGLGQAFTELRCTFGGRSIIPDVTFQIEQHIEVDDRGDMTEDVTIPPDIHIEIVSPRQTERDAHDKLLHSAAHGCAIGWLVHPYRRTIDEYRPGQEPRRLADDAVLDGAPILPGFRLPLTEVWGWMRPRRRRGGDA